MQPIPGVPQRTLGLFALALASACQAYEAHPLQLAAHARAVEARASDADASVAFTARLAAGPEPLHAPFDLSDGVSSREGEVLALFYNADLRVARAQAGVALAAFDNAGLWKDPELGVDGAQVLSPGNALEVGLRLALTLPVSGRLAAERARAGAAYEVELRRIISLEWRVRAEVRRGWRAWSVTTEKARLLREVIGQVERINGIAAHLEQAGALRKADRRLLQIELVGRRAELAAVELDARFARLDLLGLLGLAPDAALELRGDPLPPPSPSAALPELAEERGARLIRCNPELALLNAEYDLAEEALRLALRKQYPDVALGGGYGSEADDHRVLFGLSLPLPFQNANRAEIAVARAQRDLARARSETALERVARELRQTELALEAARAQRAWIEAELQPLLTEQSQNLEQLAELGDIDALLWLETVSRQFDARSRLLALALAEAHAELRWHELLGPNEPAPAPAPIPIPLTAEHESPERHSSESPR